MLRECSTSTQGKGASTLAVMQTLWCGILRANAPSLLKLTTTLWISTFSREWKFQVHTTFFFFFLAQYILTQYRSCRCNNFKRTSCLGEWEAYDSEGKWQVRGTPVFWVCIWGHSDTRRSAKRTPSKGGAKTLWWPRVCALYLGILIDSKQMLHRII